MPHHSQLLPPLFFPDVAAAVVVGVGFIMIVIDSAFVTEFPLLSFTMTVKLYLPVALGVPLITPEGLRDRPDGSLPLAIDQVYGSMPAEAFSVCEYGTPNSPVAWDTAVITGAADDVSDAPPTIDVQVKSPQYRIVPPCPTAKTSVPELPQIP